MQENMIKEFLSLVQVKDFENCYSKDIKDNEYFGMPLSSIVEAEKRLHSEQERAIAYFSMEYGLATSFYNKFQSVIQPVRENKFTEQEVFSNYRLADYLFTMQLEGLVDLPIYSGGLGVLAGDTLKTIADYKLPVVGIGMLWNIGYFKQKFWYKYGQLPEAMRWDMHTYPGLIPLNNKVKISLKSSELYLRLWKYYVYSQKHDYAIPLVLLDANVEENKEEDRHLTDQLYKSEGPAIQIIQRVILGMGGAAAINELGYKIDLFHLNEGHAVFAFVEKARGLDKDKVKELSAHFAYTCHTPVAAGHDRYPTSELDKILTLEDRVLLEVFGLEGAGTVNLTLVAMNSASTINAVAQSHQKVMQIQFPRYKDKIQCVTNGVHAPTWISDQMKSLFAKYNIVFGQPKHLALSPDRVKELKADNNFRADFWQAHQENKTKLCELFSRWKLSPDVFTICWARRIAAYKRPSMILQDAKALAELANRIGPIQIILAGKAHPKDNLGFTYINQMLDKIDELSQTYGNLKIMMLENYDIFLAKRLISSVDMWLNNPLPPFEASGTSGMKAILNGVLQLSTLDGWMAEGSEYEIGKIFGYQFQGVSLGSESDLHMQEDSKELYKALEEMMKLYYSTNKDGKADFSSGWIDMMINCLFAGTRFNTCRMLEEYMHKMWKVDL